MLRDEEISLFDSQGTPVAYIAAEREERTIYMWSGQPAAYLDDSSDDEFSIYGFNGKHLGWFVGDVVRDHQGNAVGGTRKMIGSVGFEPFKSFKQFKPFKAFKEFAPFRPYFTTTWSSTPLAEFLMGGAN
jgi:hypothetical protein